MKRKFILGLLSLTIVIFFANCMLFDEERIAEKKFEENVNKIEKENIAKLEEAIEKRDIYNYISIYEKLVKKSSFYRRDSLYGPSPDIIASMNIVKIEKYKNIYAQCVAMLEEVKQQEAKNQALDYKLEEYIASKNYSAYIKEFDEIEKDAKTNPRFAYINNKYSESQLKDAEKKKERAIKVLKIEKYKTIYDEYKKLEERDYFIRQIKGSYINELESCINSDEYFEYIAKFSNLLRKMKEFNIEVELIDKKYQKYYIDIVNHFVHKIAVNRLEFELNEKKDGYIVTGFKQHNYYPTNLYNEAVEDDRMSGRKNDIPFSFRNEIVYPYPILHGLHIVIPATYKNLPVTEIGEKAFSDPHTYRYIDRDGILQDGGFTPGAVPLELVILPHTIRQIDNYGFIAIKVAVLPKDMTVGEAYLKNDFVFGLPAATEYIGDFAMYNNSLDNLPSSLKYTGKNVFRGCSFKNFTIPKTLTKISEYLFINANISSEVIIPSSVKLIKTAAFTGSTIPSIVFSGENIKFEGGYTFSHCDSLKSITLPKNIKYIPESFCRNCTALTEIKNLPESGKIQFGENAFAGCRSLPQAVREKLISLGYKDGFFSID